jgi:hypothetical protein
MVGAAGGGFSRGAVVLLKLSRESQQMHVVGPTGGAVICDYLYYLR